MLLVVSIRLFARRGISPFSNGGAILLACSSLASLLVLWVRYQGVFAPLVVTACVANGLCLVAGGTGPLRGVPPRSGGGGARRLRAATR